jgi:hypothetical protein
LRHNLGWAEAGPKSMQIPGSFDPVISNLLQTIKCCRVYFLDSL